MTTDQQVEYWAIEAESAFGFLNSKGFAGPIRKLDVAWGNLTYRRANLGIRLEVETDAFFMFVALFAIRSGMESSPKYLQECLDDLGVQPPSELRSLHELRGKFQNCDEFVTRYARSLADSLDLIEKNRDCLFGSDW